ncbi:MAG: hypothetical protein ACRCU5_11225, partial [Rhizobiaceae bacterium]
VQNRFSSRLFSSKMTQSHFKRLIARKMAGTFNSLKPQTRAPRKECVGQTHAAIFHVAVCNVFACILQPHLSPT